MKRFMTLIFLLMFSACKTSERTDQPGGAERTRAFEEQREEEQAQRLNDEILRPRRPATEGPQPF